MNPAFGKYLMLAGLAAIAVGGLVYLLHDKLQWIGRLPGDVWVERENFKLYFPITTMILASVLLSIVLRLVRKFW